MRIWILRAAALHAIAVSATFAVQGRLTITLFDLAGVPKEVRSSAVKLAGRVFADADVRVEWSICSQPCPAEDHNVVIHVMTAATIQRQNGMLQEGDFAGYALKGSRRGYVFYDAIRDFARRSHEDPALIFGCVLVHEIAHTLGLPHQLRGVMRPDLHPHDMWEAVSGLAFPPSAARRLHDAVIGVSASN
jgi:hypothetical protein